MQGEAVRPGAGWGGVQSDPGTSDARNMVKGRGRTKLGACGTPGEGSRQRAGIGAPRGPADGAASPELARPGVGLARGRRRGVGGGAGGLATLHPQEGPGCSAAATAATADACLPRAGPDSPLRLRHTERSFCSDRKKRKPGKCPRAFSSRR